MNQSRLRLTVFSLWLGALVLSIVAVLLSPLIRGVGIVDHTQAARALPGTLSLYVPALSVLAGFWLPTGERRNAARHAPERYRAFVALALTVVFLLVALGLLLWPLY